MDGEVRDYNRWRDQRLAADPNADVSPEAYQEAKFAAQSSYGLGPASEAGQQAQQEQQNAAVARWWANNPNAEPFRQGGPFVPKEYRNALDPYVPIAEQGLPPWAVGR